MTAIWMFLAAVCVLGPLIALHEWGHYIVARLCGVKVITYSIGFGPKLLGWTSKRSGIDYRIGAIPLGGYVKMLDERESPIHPSQKALAFNHQHPLKKIAIVAAGPLMNFLIAIGLFWVLFLVPSEQLNTRIGDILPQSPAYNSGLMVGDKILKIDSKPVETWEQVGYALADKAGETTEIALQVENLSNQVRHVIVPINRFMQSENQKTTQDPISSLGIAPFTPIIEPVIGEVIKNSVAEKSGLQVADKVLAIDDVLIQDWKEATKIIRQKANQPIQVQVQRNQEMLTLTMTPAAIKTQQGLVGQIGVKVAFDANKAIPSNYRVVLEHTPFEALKKSFIKTYDLAEMTLKSLSKMFTGLIGLDNISGPITIAEVSKQSFEIGWKQVLSTAGLISLSLAVLNLLPIPILDGGHLVFYTYELIFGKAISQSVQMIALRFGMILLFCFMALAISNDISRLFG